jgi:hypothetical protein
MSAFNNFFKNVVASKKRKRLLPKLGPRFSPLRVYRNLKKIIRKGIGPIPPHKRSNFVKRVFKPIKFSFKPVKYKSSNPVANVLYNKDLLRNIASYM